MAERNLRYRDRSRDPADWARELGISIEAVQLYLACEVIDLHTDSFVWTRVIPGYDLAKRHRPRLPRSAFLNQVDLPRLREAGVAAVSWDIPTNPLRRRTRRPDVARRNIGRIIETLSRFADDFALARHLRDYRSARASGLTAGFISIQGALALDRSLDDLASVADVVHRITLVELTESRVGVPSLKRRKAHVGLSDFGQEYVRRMQANRIIVDLAHVNRRGFFDALDVADPSIPVIVSHTGVSGVHPMWRNIDDEQIRAVADRGGTVGIMLHPHYLARGWSCPLSRVIDHMEYMIRVAGDDFVSLGSDFDGMISLPDGFREILHLPKLVALMLERGWSADRITKVMGGNYLRVLGAIRP